MATMRSNVLTLRTVKRGKDNVLTIESSGATPRKDSVNQDHNYRRLSSHHHANPIDTRHLHIDQPIHLISSLHDARTSNKPVLIDVSQFPGASEGDVAELQLDDKSNKNKKLYFIVTNMNDELLRRSKITQLSLISGPLPTLLNMSSSRNPVIVKLKDKDSVQADLVEIFIRDIYLNRGDMWELSSKLNGTCLYKSQRLTFIETIRGTVNTIYRSGKKRFSGYIGEQTKIVFRSESARLLFLIQITEEMYHFHEDGEVMFHKVVNSLFPTIFKKWREEGTHHLITIVFAANIDLSKNSSVNKLKEGERPKYTKDYYRVVIDQVNVLRWSEIMISLRYEFANFRKEIISQQLKEGEENTSMKFLPSIKSDILNTINLSTTLIVDRFKDPDLRHTTNNFIVISAGNGLYDVDYDNLIDTGKRLLHSEISVDIICLAQQPLHLTPLFRYRDHLDRLHHCVPGWIDVSYWNESIARGSTWQPRCRIYELQMMGIMEYDMNAVTLEHLNYKYLDTSISNVMDNHDKDIFKKVTPSDTYITRPSTPDLTNSKTLSTKSSSSLPWKVSNSTVTKTTDVQKTASPIFTSVSKSALSSLKEIGEPHQQQQQRTNSSSPIVELKRTPSNESLKKFHTLPIPQKIKNFNSTQHKFNIKQARANISSSPNSTSSTQVTKGKFTAIDSMKTIMWTELDNISKQLSHENLEKLNVGKWQDVFPTKVKRRIIKWRSLSSPSELPVTTPLFPTLEDFENNFFFQTHTIFLSTEREKYMNVCDLMREMIHLRLMLGFQICFGEAVSKIESKRQLESNSSLLIKYLPEKNFEGSRIYLSLDQEIHRISCEYDDTINVQIYHRVDDARNFYHETFDRLMIRTRYQRYYHSNDLDPIVVRPRVFNWNKYDQTLAGYEDSDDTNTNSRNRLKFVLLPSEIPKSTFLTSSNVKQEQLTPEETRVEGLRRLIATLHRGVFNPDDNKDDTKKRRKAKEEATPEINFYTGNLIPFLEEQHINSSSSLKRTTSQATSFNADNPTDGTYLTKDVSLNELFKELQGSKGIKLNDRRWHWKLHKKSFLGFELVTWLVDNFQDIDTREEATQFGNELMERGFIFHVENRHKFLDGYYFYRLVKEEPVDTIPPVNPPIENKIIRTRSESITSKSSKFSMTPVIPPQSEDSDSLLRKTISEVSELPKINSKEDKKHVFILSNSLTYDLDPMRNSYKRELITVHYDTVHNPNHCFHIRLEWLTATPKLIDDVINSWSKMCDRYGLKLVEIPWGELCEIPKLNPFHSYVDISLAINPWEDDEFNIDDIIKVQKFYFHIYLLEKSGFLMDNRASMFFKNIELSDNNFEIMYSWGKPTFKYAQYIHKTGAYIAEIRDTGDLFLAPNNTHIARVNTSTQQNPIQNNSSGPQSNSIPSEQQQQQQQKQQILDSQKIMLEFRATCLDSIKLRKIFVEAKLHWMANSFASNQPTPVTDLSTPSGTPLSLIPDDLTI